MLENVAGKSARRMAAERQLTRRQLGFVAIAAVIEIVLVYVSLPTAIGFPLALLGLWAVRHYFFGWMDHVFQREQDAVRGAEAEEVVGAILDSLTDCVTLHDVTAGYGNIDHVIFRKDGAVFLVETKSPRGLITELRAEKYLQQTHRNVYWLRDLLKTRFNLEPWIHAAIVFPNAHVRVPHALRGVHILSAADLEYWISLVRGNGHIACQLWPRMGEIKAALVGQSARSEARSRGPRLRLSA